MDNLVQAGGSLFEQLRAKDPSGTGKRTDRHVFCQELLHLGHAERYFEREDFRLPSTSPRFANGLVCSSARPAGVNETYTCMVDLIFDDLDKPTVSFTLETRRNRHRR